MMQSYFEREQAQVGTKSFIEPRQRPRALTGISIQFYAGEFLRHDEVQKISQKRSHSFGHRTFAHSLCQGHNEYPTDDGTLKIKDSDWNEECVNASPCGKKAPRSKKDKAGSLHRDQQVTKDHQACRRRFSFVGKKGQGQSPKAGKDVKHAEDKISETMGCTIVVRNLPRCMSQNELFDRLVEVGLNDDLVLLYMPCLMGRAEQANLGYAFVHLESRAAKRALDRAWQGKFPFGSLPTSRPINIALAAIQGAEENIASWNLSKKMARIRNPCFRPMILNRFQPKGMGTGS